MSRTFIVVLCLLLLPLSISTVSGDEVDSGAVAVAGEFTSVYEALKSFDFPEGILPKGVLSYDLDESTGKFHAYLSGSCSFSLEGSYKLKYKSTISGYIQKDRLTSLTGVTVKVLFLWLNIVEVIRKGDDLEFSVGIASASFPVDNFEECPQCGCGMDCKSVKLRKIGTDPALVSSV